MAVVDEGDAAAGTEGVPPRMPETMLEVFDGADEALEVDDGAAVVDAPNENDGVEAGAGELAAGAAGLAAPNPVKPPKGFALAGGCEAALELGAVAEAPKLKVGAGVEAAGAAAEDELPNPPPRLAKGLVPVDAPNGEADDGDAAAPKLIGPAATAAPGAPGVPGVPRRLGRPRMTLPAAGVAGIEPCDGESSSEASSPSSLRICFSA